MGFTTNKKKKLKGVSYHRPSDSWVSRISKDGIDFSLGYFPNHWEAGLAYDAAVMILHEGEETNEEKGLLADMPDEVASKKYEIQEATLRKIEEKIRLISA